MASQAHVVYSDFSKGEYGTLGGRRAPDGSWTGLNMRVYRNGSLGVRPGLHDLAVTGMPAGTVKGIAYIPFTGKELIVVVGTSVRFVSFAQAAAVSASAGTLTATPTYPIRFSESTRSLDGRVYFQNPGDGSYYATPAAVTLTALTNDPTGFCMELYKNRMVAGGPAERLRYSNDSVFDTWSSLQFIDVGYNYPAFQMVSHRDGLSVFAQALIWRFTGTIGSTQVLRRASSGLAISTQGDAVLDNERVFYIPGARTAPVIFDGGTADEKSLAHLEWHTDSAGTTDPVSGGIARRYNDILFSNYGYDRGLWRSSGAWTFHEWGVTQSGLLTRAAADKFVIASDGTTPSLYVLDASLDRPGFTSDTYADPGDISDTQLSGNFTLPEYWDPQLKEVRVRAVTVNFTKWNTGGLTTNNFTLTVTALDQYGGGAPVASATQSFNEAGSAATTAGVDQRAVFYFGDQGPGGGFQIALTAIRGVAIRDIVVSIETLPSRAE